MSEDAGTGQGNGQGNTQNEQNDQVEQLSELELLKNRARMLGITHSNNISVDTLRAKIEAKMNGTDDQSDQETDPKNEGAGPNPLSIGATSMNAQGMVVTDAEPTRPKTLQEWVYEENMHLVRCRITNLDPKKKDLPGEIFTVANEYLGTVKKFVPFGEHTEDGYHVPYCIYQMMKSRRFLNIRTTRDKRTGTERVFQTWAPEFALEVMEPLTKDELRNLAQAQIAAGSVDANAA